MGAVSDMNIFGHNGLNVNEMVSEIPGKIVDTGIAAGKAGTAVAIGASVGAVHAFADTAFDIAKGTMGLACNFTLGAAKRLTGVSDLGKAYATFKTLEQRKTVKVNTLGIIKDSDKFHYIQTEQEIVRKFSLRERAGNAWPDLKWGMGKLGVNIAIGHGAYCQFAETQCSTMSLGTATSYCFNAVASAAGYAGSEVKAALPSMARATISAVSNNPAFVAAVVTTTVLVNSARKDYQGIDSNAGYFEKAKTVAFAGTKVLAGLALVGWSVKG